MFFAFNGVQPSKAKETDYATIYCVNVHELASLWAVQNSRNVFGDTDGPSHNKLFGEFMIDYEGLFEKGYPSGILKYISLPASWNRRMVRQLGVFLYDTLSYPFDKRKDLEDYLSQEEIPTPTEPKRVILTKVTIPWSAGKEIFERLDIMGISGTQLFDSPDGAVMDVVNAYNYGRKTGYAWDVRMLVEVTEVRNGVE